MANLDKSNVVNGNIISASDISALYDTFTGDATYDNISIEGTSSFAVTASYALNASGGGGGTSGTSGISGTSGQTGTSGISGTSGESGTAGSSGTSSAIGGSDSYIQYNNGGVLGGESTFVYDDTNNRVGIGTGTPSYPLHVTSQASNISIYASYNIVAYSDARSKTNVEIIDNALEKVSQMRGVTYNKVEDPEGASFTGVIAQEVLPHLPEAVLQGEDGHYSVAYGNMVGILIEAIKELKAEIDELKANK